MASTDVLERSFEATGPVTLRVGIPSGTVEVTATDSSTVDVEVTPERGNGSALEHVTVNAAERAGGLEVSVRAQFERGGFHIGRRGASLRVRIACPSGTSLEVSSASADVQATGELGDARVKTASGDVDADRVAALIVQTVSGDVSAREVDGDVVVKTTSGDVGARSVAGDLVVTAVSGDIDVGTVTGELQVTTVSGDVQIGALSGAANVNSVSGDVELGVVPGRRLWFDVRSASGDVRSDLDVGDAPPPSDDAPVAELTVRTVSGDVRIRRART
jgi:putative adhesin